MKTLYSLALGAFLATGLVQGAWAQSESAYDNANCNASFQRGCDDSDASSNSDAPLPLLGAGPLALAALGAAAVIRRRRRAVAV